MGRHSSVFPLLLIPCANEGKSAQTPRPQLNTSPAQPIKGETKFSTFEISSLQSRSSRRGENCGLSNSSSSNLGRTKLRGIGAIAGPSEKHHLALATQAFFRRAVDAYVETEAFTGCRERRG